MRQRGARGAPVLATAALVALSSLVVTAPARAASGGSAPEILIFTLDGATLEALLSTPGFAGLAHVGGAALMSVEDPANVAVGLDRSLGVGRGLVPFWTRYDLGSVEAPGGGTSSAALCDEAAASVREVLDASKATETLVFVASSSPPSINEESGDHLGALIMAEGPPADLATAMRTVPARPAGTLTSDSTRREGVVTSQDLAQTTIAAAKMRTLSRDPGGAEIRMVDAPPPVDLHARYLQSKRLTVPIGSAAALFVTIAGVLALAMLLWSGSPRWSRTVMAWVAISAPFLALSLLLVGHLASLTYVTVIPFVGAVTALGTLALVPVARRKGTLNAVAAAGVILLVALAIEAALGWTAALTPLLGGSQLDGGRFYGLPNAFIGLLLGGSIYVAQRLPRSTGTVVIAATGLFAGLPWTGSNIGGAVTLFAGAGIWWGLRGRAGWLRTALATIVSVAAGTGLVVVANRYLTSAPTHITRFAEQTGGFRGLWSKLADRLQVGTDLIARNPFALVPVLGVLFTLALVLRPPAAVRVTFSEGPGWREALLAIVLGSVVAYLANDSGAAAIGEGFTTSLAALLYVSLLLRIDIMEER